MLQSSRFTLRLGPETVKDFEHGTHDFQVRQNRSWRPLFGFLRLASARGLARAPASCETQASMFSVHTGSGRTGPKAVIETFVPASKAAGPCVLLVDHYDSFTYNLVQLALQLGAKVHVVRSDAFEMQQISNLGASHLILSPGPGHPADAGARPALWKAALSGRTPPVLGVCLGHQGLCLAAGAQVIAAPRILHGKISELSHAGQGLFASCPESFDVVRYHSLLVDEASLPKELVPSAWVPRSQGPRELMAVHHAKRPLFGVQFHPESVASACGAQLLSNFLER